MSIIDRANVIPYYVKEYKQGKRQSFQHYLDLFTKFQEDFENIESPTEEQQKDYDKKKKEFIEKLEKAEKLTEDSKPDEKEIVKHLLNFQKIKDDPRTPDLIKNVKEFAKSYNSVLAKQKEHALDEDGVLIKGKVGKMAAATVNTDTLSKIFKKHTGTFDRTEIDAVIASIPTVTIQSNSDLSKWIDEIQAQMAEDPVDPKKVHATLKEIRKFVKEPEKCSKCNAKNTQLFGGFCEVCIIKKLDDFAERIIERYREFDHDKKSYQDNYDDLDDYSRFIGNIENLKEEHDNAFNSWESSHTLKNYEAYLKAHEAIDKALPVSNGKKKSKERFVSDPIIDDDSESEYSSDSSSSHSLRKPKKRDRENEVTVAELLDTFQDFHVELKRLCSVSDRPNFREEFENSKKNLKKFRPYLIDNHTGERVPIEFQNNIYPSRERADEEGQRLSQMFKGYKYMIEEI